MFDWKIMLGVLAAVLLLSGGLLKDIKGGVQKGDVKKFFKKVIDEVGKVISASDFRVSVARDIPVSGKVAQKDEYDFKGTAIDTVNVKYSPGTVNVTMDKNRVNVNRNVATIALKKFRGDVEISQGEMDLDGKVNSVSSQQVNLEGGEISVKLAGEFIRASLKDVKVNELDLGQEGGQLQVGTSVSLSSEEKPLKLYHFLGDLTFSDQSLKVEGNVSKVAAGSKEVSISMS